MRKSVTAFDWLNGGFLIVLAIVCVFPFLNILSVSLSNGNEVTAGRVVAYPVGLNIQTYKYIFTNPTLGISRAVLNSVIYTVCGTLFAVLLTYMTAYPLSRKKFKGRYFIMMAFVMSWIFTAGLIPNYLVQKALGLVNNPLVMIIPGAISTFLLIICRSFLDTLPDELEESAFMDGANDFRIMWSIYLPLSMPVLATIGTFYAIGIWNQFLVPLIYLQDSNLHPIQLILYNLVIKPDPNSTSMESTISNGISLIPKNLQAATMVLAIFPIMLVYPFAQRYFTKGMLIGSIKG